MYYYIYDAYLADKKYHKTLAKIETRLTDLGISGKINRLSVNQNTSPILVEELKRGLKTLVVVGNDRTVGHILNLLSDFSTTIGIIPIGPHNQIAELAGIIDSDNACEILSSRIVEKLDLGVINGQYHFLTALTINHQPVRLDCENSYSIDLADASHRVRICNVGPSSLCRASDGQLDTYITQERQQLWRRSTVSTSRLRHGHLSVTSDQPVSIILEDEQKIIKTPVTITVSPKKLKLIVGKNRQF